MLHAGVSGTVVPTRYSANLVHTPLCTRVFGADVPSTAVPARFSAKFGHTPLCTGAFARLCQVRLCPFVPLEFSLLSSGTRRCVRARWLLRRQGRPGPLRSPRLRAHAVVCSRVDAEVPGTAVPARFPTNIVHTLLCTRAMEAEVSGAAVPAGLSRMSVCTPLCTGGFVAEASSSVAPARSSAILACSTLRSRSIWSLIEVA